MPIICACKNYMPASLAKSKQKLQVTAEGCWATQTEMMPVPFSDCLDTCSGCRQGRQAESLLAALTSFHKETIVLVFPDMWHSYVTPPQKSRGCVPFVLWGFYRAKLKGWHLLAANRHVTTDSCCIRQRLGDVKSCWNQAPLAFI